MSDYSLRVFLCVIGLTFFTHHNALANTPSRYIELEDIKLQRKPCQSGYEPISLSTAMMYQQRLAAKMGEWQLTNIENGLIIMGPGHKGNIKIANRLAYTSWCIESDKKNTYQADVSLLPDTKSTEQTETRMAYGEFKRILRAISRAC